MQEITDVGKFELLSETQKMKNQGFRLAQVCATKPVSNPENLILLYSFANEEQLKSLRITLEQDEKIESISGLYPYAFIYENEMKDLFGVKVEDINLDFKGNFYKTSIKTPFISEKEEVRTDG